MSFEITKELIEQVVEHIGNKNNVALTELFSELHHADIAEVVEEISFDEAVYVIKLLDSETTSEVLIDLDENTREKIFAQLTAKEIAEEVSELDTDDAADIIAELSEERQGEVMQEIEDASHAREIEELLGYDEDTAGGLMAKELVKVNENWSVLKCVKEMRAQAEAVTRVHSIYVVDDQGRLRGRLSLKDLLVASTKTPIREIYIPKVDAVHVNDKAEDVANVMHKYDLEAIPVVNEFEVLVGRITIDDIVDVIKEEAEKDYQMAAGLSEDVDSDDSIFKMTRARLPWLLIGMVSGTVAASIIGDFQVIMNKHIELILFIPLINSSAGNVGVQSSAIVVQSIANKTFKGKLLPHILKQLMVGLINGLVMAAVVFGLSQFFFHSPISISYTVTIALVTVVINAAVVGTIIPIVLDKLKFDPAIATGPFVTTSNDIFGILIYFSIARVILGI